MIYMFPVCQDCGKPITKIEDLVIAIRIFLLHSKFHSHTPEQIMELFNPFKYKVIHKTHPGRFTFQGEYFHVKEDKGFGKFITMLVAVLAGVLGLILIGISLFTIYFAIISSFLVFAFFGLFFFAIAMWIFIKIWVGKTKFEELKKEIQCTSNNNLSNSTNQAF